MTTEQMEEWVSQWLFKTVVSDPQDLHLHVMITTFCRAIVIDYHTEDKKLQEDETKARAILLLDYAKSWPFQTNTQTSATTYEKFLRAEVDGRLE